MQGPQKPPAKGRGAQIKSPNRFERVHCEDDFEHLEFDEELLAASSTVCTQSPPTTPRVSSAKTTAPT